MCYIIDNHNLLLCSVYYNNITISVEKYVTMTRYIICIKMSYVLIIVIKESYHFAIVTAF